MRFRKEGGQGGCAAEGRGEGTYPFDTGDHLSGGSGAQQRGDILKYHSPEKPTLRFDGPSKKGQRPGRGVEDGRWGRERTEDGGGGGRGGGQEGPSLEAHLSQMGANGR